MFRITPSGALWLRSSGSKPWKFPTGSRLASTMHSMTSALAIALRTDVNINSSSLLNSSRITPGVSRSTIWYSSSLTIPKILCLVV